MQSIATRLTRAAAGLDVLALRLAKANGHDPVQRHLRLCILARARRKYISSKLSLDSFIMSPPVPMLLSRIIISEISDNQVIYLKEVEGERQFPILIGIFEATSIDRRVKAKATPPRPLTHDLIVNIAEALGAQVESVVISDLQDQTYFAHLRLKRGEEIIEIDSRPSDAIAVAVTFQPPLPIFVTEEVLDRVTGKL